MAVRSLYRSVGDEHEALIGRIRVVTRSTIEVAHFRYFVSERRGSLTPILISKKTFCRLVPWNYSPRCNLIFAEKSVFGWGMELLK